MARFIFTADGFFVNVDMITTMKVKGPIGKLEAIEIWFSGQAGKEPGLTLRFEAANELFDALLKIHKMIGWSVGGHEEDEDPESGQ